MLETTKTTGGGGAGGARGFIRADRLRLTEDPTLNEHWLRERIVDDPSVLGLGDLRLADEGRTRDGRLELLLRDPASGRRLTVLVRVGPAEDSDLVRAIENWTVERGRYPEHEHFAVVVAEELPRRFLSAANTLGSAIPLSAMQVSALRVGEHVALHFTVVVDRLPPRAMEHPRANGANGAKGAHGTAKRQATAETLPAAEPAAPTDAPVSEQCVAQEIAVTVAPPSRPTSDVKLPAWLSDEADDDSVDEPVARRGRGK
jgi:hypothetical protein